VIKLTATPLPDPDGSSESPPAASRDRSPDRTGGERQRRRGASFADSLSAWLRRVMGRARPQARAVERLEGIASLYETTILAGKGSDPDFLLELACHHLAAALDAALVAVLVPGAGGSGFELGACHGARSGLATDIVVHTEEGAIGAVTLSGLPAVLGARELAHGPPAERALAGLGDLIVVPLRSQGKRNGLLLIGGGCVLEGDDSLLVLDRVGEGLGSVVAQHARQREASDRLQTLDRVNRELLDHQRESEIFLATAIHELRTPLSGIVSYAEVLADYYDTLSVQERRSFLATLNVQCKTIMGLVDQLFDFARLESGKLALDAESTQVSELVRSAVDVMSPVATERGLRLESHIANLGPVLLDPTKIRQCVLNLVSNAMKFTPAPGRVSVRLSAGAEGIEIRVSDTGKGIPPDELQRIFELFHSGATRTTGKSLGLGLYLVKSFVELHGGKMLVESRPGEGSTFGFALPWGSREGRVARESSAA
jgi:signal transduction histidine kinase